MEYCAYHKSLTNKSHKTSSYPYILHYPIGAPYLVRMIFDALCVAGLIHLQLANWSTVPPCKVAISMTYTYSGSESTYFSRGVFSSSTHSRHWFERAANSDQYPIDNQHIGCIIHNDQNWRQDIWQQTFTRLKTSNMSMGQARMLSVGHHFI